MSSTEFSYAWKSNWSLPFSSFCDTRSNVNPSRPENTDRKIPPCSKKMKTPQSDRRAWAEMYSPRMNSKSEHVFVCDCICADKGLKAKKRRKKEDTRDKIYPFL